ncbi:hypothetical protein ES703_91067 [subsurface metagenome]
MQGRAQDHHVHRHAALAPDKGILADDNQLAFLFRSFGNIGYLAGTPADEHRPLVEDAVVKLLKSLAHAPEVDIELIYQGSGHVLPYQVAQLHRVHAANLRAILVVFLVSAAHAVDNTHRLGVGTVLEEHLSRRRPRGVNHPLELEGGEHVIQPPVAVLVKRSRVEGIEAGGDDDIAHLHLYRLLFHILVDGAHLAGIETLHTLRANAAVQAALGFLDSRLLVEAQFNLGKAFPLIYLQGGHILPQLGLHSLFGYVFYPLPGNGPTLFQVDPPQLSVYRDGGFLTRRDSSDNVGRSRNHIPAGENAFDISLQGSGVNDHRPPPRVLQLLGQHCLIDALPHGKDDVIHAHLELGALNRHRAPTSALIRLAQLHLDALDTGNFVTLGNNLNRSRQYVQLYAFFFGFVNLVATGGHLGPGAPVDNGNLFGSQSLGDSGGVYSGVTAADNGHPLPETDLAPRINLIQEVEGVKHALGVLIGDTHLLAYQGAGRQEYRLIALVKDIFELLHRAVGLYLHPQLLQVADFIIQHLVGQAVFGNAVAQQPARLGGGFENGNRVAFPYQVVGAG